MYQIRIRAVRMVRGGRSDLIIAVAFAEGFADLVGYGDEVWGVAHF
jgi:hypothetical protein